MKSSFVRTFFGACILLFSSALMIKSSEMVIPSSKAEKPLSTQHAITPMFDWPTPPSEGASAKESIITQPSRPAIIPAFDWPTPPSRGARVPESMVTLPANAGEEKSRSTGQAINPLFNWPTSPSEQPGKAVSPASRVMQEPEQTATIFETVPKAPVSEDNQFAQDVIRAVRMNGDDGVMFDSRTCYFWPHINGKSVLMGETPIKYSSGRAIMLSDFNIDLQRNVISGAAHSHQDKDGIFVINTLGGKTYRIQEAFDYVVQEYKIHLMPKDEDMSGTLIRLLDAIKSNPMLQYAISEIKTKLYLEKNYQQLFGSETSLPKVIIYVIGKNNAQGVLNEVYRIFGGQQGIGRAPDYNEEVTSLIYVAQGNRDDKRYDNIRDYYFDPKNNYAFMKNDIIGKLTGTGKIIEHRLINPNPAKRFPDNQ